MKYEETSDITTVLIEPDDDQTAVVRWVSNQSKAVVLVIPENVNSVFQRPGDFHELKQVMRHRETSIMLVMPGNERLKYWARRQGFPVFSSSEACARMLAQYGPMQPMSATTSRTTGTLARNNSSVFKLHTALARHQNSRITEELVPPYEKTREHQHFVGFAQQHSSDLVHAGSGGQSTHDSGVRLSPTALSHPSTDALRLSIAPSRSSIISGLSVTLKDKTLLILLALLVLGVLGGIGFGYLLSLFHLAMR